MSSVTVASRHESGEGALDVPAQWRLSRAFVPRGRYIDPEFAALEVERLFPRTWLNACRVDEVEQVGQYVDFEICGQSIVVVRTAQGLRAYFNACRHRGTRLVQGQGRIGEFRCPFHAWRWNLDGSLKYMADDVNFDPRPAEELCLPECRVDTWGGWVFINMDGRAEPLLDYLAPLPERMEGYKLEDMRIAWYKRIILPANWKTSLDAFIESWHVSGTHPQLMRPDRQMSPPTIAESESYGGTFNELFRYHSRHADILRYGRTGTRRVAHDVRSGLRGDLPDRGVFATRAARPLPPDRPGGRRRAPDHRGCRRAVGQRHLPAAAQEACPSHRYRLPGAQPGAVEERHVRLARLPEHRLPGRYGQRLDLSGRPNGDDPDSCIFDVQGLELPPATGIATAEPQFFENWREGTWVPSSRRTSPTCPR